MKHLPVLFEEVNQAMNIQQDSICLDGTFGRGGHSREILRRLGENGCLIAIDQDAEAIDSQ